MAEKYAGSAVLEVNGVEIEITDLNVTKQTGRKLVKTMNSEVVHVVLPKELRLGAIIDCRSAD